jgi:hypothetical protein
MPDAGRRLGTTTGDVARIRELERENRELRSANEILLTAAASSSVARGARPAFTVVVAFVDDRETGSASRRSAACSPRTACQSRRTANTPTPSPAAIAAVGA